MKIIGLELIPLTMIFKASIEESFGTVGKQEDNVIVRIHTDEGISGIGEGCTLGPFYCGESQETVMGIIASHLYPKVLEGADPFNIDPIHYKMDKVVYANTVAKATVDYAIYDIMGKALNVPLYKLLGGKFCDKIPTRASVGIDDPDKMAAKAKHCHELGFGGIKMKVGLEPLLDIERVKAIRKAIGPDMLIDIDVNGAYSPKDAIYVLRRVADCGNIIVEQPVNRDDLSGMALVRRSVDIPIGACEAALTQQQIMRVIKMEAADFFITILLTYGGVNLFIVVWLMVTIAKPLYEELDIPWHLYMCEMWAMGTITLSMLPGTPSMVNIIPMSYLGTTTMAAPVLGLLCSLFCTVLCLSYTYFQLQRATKRGEHFLPTGALIQQRLGVKNAEEETDGAEKAIPFILAILPSILMLIALNVFLLSPVYAMLIGCIMVYALFFKRLPSLNKTLADGATQAVVVSMSVAMVVGFGSVVAATSGYKMIIAALTSLAGPAIIQVVMAVEVAAGVTGSTSGGLAIALEQLSGKFLATGIKPAVIHRMACIASSGLDSLPQSAGVVNALSCAGLS